MTTKLKVVLWFALISGGILNSWGEELSSIEKEFYEKFSNFQLFYREARTYPAEKEFRDNAKEKADALYKELLRDPEETGKILFAVFDKSTSTTRKSDSIHFAGIHGLAKEQFLPAMRGIIENADLAANYTPVLGAAVIYIEKNGNVADIKLLSRLSTHFNPGIKSGSAYAIRRIQEREKSSVKTSTPSTPKIELLDSPEPTFAKKPSTSEKKPIESEVVAPTPDNSFPYWIFIVGGVVVVGLIVVLKRK